MTRMLLMKYEQSLSEDAVNKLQRIAANAKQETELLADLLELSRLRAQPGKTERTDLNALLTSLAEALDYELEQKAITLNIGPLPTVLGDRNRLRQVFQNLLENAIKYMPADAPQRRIDVGCQQRDGAVHFYVKDTGPGIAPEDQQRIFQVFQRARYSGSTDADGRGVGLSTVKAIVETMGGKLWVQSTVGRGATFYFTFSDLVTEPSATPAPVETVGQAATD
jgi:signal transduction histidine kinase